jgi:transposase
MNRSLAGQPKSRSLARLPHGVSMWQASSPTDRASAHLDDFIGEDNPVRAVDAFVEMLDLRNLGFSSVDPKATGRPSYHRAILLKLYVYTAISTPSHPAAGSNARQDAMSS